MDAINVAVLNPVNEQSNVESVENVSQSNKENLNSEFGKPRSSRMSILQCLDPLNPYSPCKIKEEIRESTIFSIDESNESWNLLDLDKPENFNSLSEIVNATPFDSCEKDALSGLNDKNYDFENTLNESQFLDISVEDNKVVVDNLLCLSPMKPVVDKSVYKKLKKIHVVKRSVWLETEKRYLEEIENLKIQNEKYLSILTEQETKIELLTKERESLIIEMNDYKKQIEIDCKNHKLKIIELEKEKESIINDLVKENEENIETLQSKHSKLLILGQLELNKIIKEHEILIEEMLYLNSCKLFDECLLDEYCDALEEGLRDFELKEAKLAQDNIDMELILNKYTNKYKSSTDVINSLKQNSEVLQDLLKKRDMKIAILEKAQLNLNRELELRISERDSYKDTLDNYLQ